MISLRTPSLFALAAMAASVIFAAEPESLDKWLEDARTQSKVPAMAAIVFRADSVAARGVAGVRRSDAKTPVEIGDRFQLGSNTKAITATIIATLVEEGKLTWATTLAEAFPDLSETMTAEFRGATIDLLLSHHAGISGFTDTDDPDFKSLPRLTGSPEQRRAAFAAWALRGKAAGPVGGAGLYSNGGYTIAAAIAERLAGTSWESLVHERVFKPLGIAGTFAWSETADPNQPWGHHETRKGTKSISPRDAGDRVPAILWPAGAVELSLDDYARFLQANLRGLQGRDTQILKAATIKHLHTSPVTPPDKFALGWGVQEVDSAPSSVHAGSAGAFYAVTILQPTRDLGVAVFSNDGGERAAKAVAEASKALVRRFGATAVAAPPP